MWKGKSPGWSGVKTHLARGEGAKHGGRRKLVHQMQRNLKTATSSADPNSTCDFISRAAVKERSLFFVYAGDRTQACARQPL